MLNPPKKVIVSTKKTPNARDTGDIRLNEQKIRPGRHPSSAISEVEHPCMHCNELMKAHGSITKAEVAEVLHEYLHAFKD